MSLTDKLLEDEQEPFDSGKPYQWTFAGATINQRKTPADESDLVAVLKKLNPSEFDGIRIFNKKFGAASANVLFGTLGGKPVFIVARSEGRLVGKDGVWSVDADSAVAMAVAQIS